MHHWYRHDGQTCRIIRAVNCRPSPAQTGRSLLRLAAAFVGTAGVARPLAKDAELPATADAALAQDVAFLRQYLTEPLDDATLARHAGLSVRVLDRRFREAFRLAPRQYLRRETRVTPREYRERFRTRSEAWRDSSKTCRWSSILRLCSAA